MKNFVLGVVAAIAVMLIYQTFTQESHTGLTPSAQPKIESSATQSDALESEQLEDGVRKPDVQDSEPESDNADPVVKEPELKDVLEWVDSEMQKDVSELSISELIFPPDWVVGVLRASGDQTFPLQRRLIEYRAKEPEFLREKYRLEGISTCLRLLRDHSPLSGIEDRARLGFALNSSIDSVIYLDLLSNGGRVHEITDDSGEFDDLYDRDTYDWKTRVMFELQQSVIYFTNQEVPYYKPVTRYLSKKTRPKPSETPKMHSRFAGFIGLPVMPSDLRVDLITLYERVEHIQVRRVPKRNPFQD